MTRKRDGPFASSWWGVKWIELLESFGWTNRLARGREIAREGKVRALEVSAAGARARVRGTGAQPFDVEVALAPLPASVVARVVQTMAEKASFAASLLSGRIPEDIEAAFVGTGRTLLPETARELSCHCTCPDTVLPCKHVAAVCYLLAERFDRDPFLIFLLRGLEKAELLRELRRHRNAARGPRAEGARSRRRSEHRHELPLEPLPDVKPEQFFRPLVPVAQLRTALTTPDHPEAVLARLGPPPLEDPEAASLLTDLHRAIGIGAKERLSEWEWKMAWREKG